MFFQGEGNKKALNAKMHLGLFYTNVQLFLLKQFT